MEFRSVWHSPSEKVKRAASRTARLAELLRVPLNSIHISTRKEVHELRGPRRENGGFHPLMTPVVKSSNGKGSMVSRHGGVSRDLDTAQTGVSETMGLTEPTEERE